VPRTSWRPAGREGLSRPNRKRNLFSLGPIVDTVRASDAAAADISSCPALLQERKVFGDQAYWKEADRQAVEDSGVRYAARA
jgi:hypothetical protein